MKQQTAVEWLVKMLYSPVCKGFIEGRTQIPFHIIEEAKAIEKEQIMNAYTSGESDGEHYEYAALEYYNETYQDKSAGGACEVN